MSNLVSFEAGSRSYIKWPNATASDNTIDLILRFKTSYPDGLMVYGVDGPSVFSLRMESGMLTFKSGGVHVSSTQAYNDDQWHVVFLGHTSAQLVLLVDDFDSFQCVLPYNPTRQLLVLQPDILPPTPTPHLVSGPTAPRIP